MPSRGQQGSIINFRIPDHASYDDVNLDDLYSPYIGLPLCLVLLFK